MRHITFGTSGWRAVLGEDFTFQNVRMVCQAIVHVLKQEKIGHRGLIIGYDSRFLGEKFAKTAAEVFAGHGMSVLLCDRETPTPAISYHVLQHNLAGGVNISASHNPPEYNGIKFTPEWGGPALPETTRAIEQRLLHLLHGEHVKWLPWEKAERTQMVQLFDPCPDYLAALGKHIDVDVIREADLRVVMDPLYGTSRGYLDKFLRDAGAKMAVLHYWRDPYFGGIRPEPTRETTAELQETVKQGQCPYRVGHRWRCRSIRCRGPGRQLYRREYRLGVTGGLSGDDQTLDRRCGTIRRHHAPHRSRGTQARLGRPGNPRGIQISRGTLGQGGDPDGWRRKCGPVDPGARAGKGRDSGLPPGDGNDCPNQEAAPGTHGRVVCSG